MVRGNFRIADAPTDVRDAGAWRAIENGVAFAEGTLVWNDAALTFTSADPAFDRICLRFLAEPGETVWGGGEQMSYLALTRAPLPDVDQRARRRAATRPPN